MLTLILKLDQQRIMIQCLKNNTQLWSINIQIVTQLTTNCNSILKTERECLQVITILKTLQLLLLKWISKFMIKDSQVKNLMSII